VKPPRLFSKAEIVAALARIAPEDVIEAMRQGFEAYSSGKAQVAPVTHLPFADPPGDVHVKCGYITGGEFFVIKLASGFYQNGDLGLPASSGAMLLASTQNGFPAALLVDEAYLTDVRTAAAGALAAALLAPKFVEAIGIVGTGAQAHLQLAWLEHVTACRTAFVWGRDPAKARAFAVDGFTVTPVSTLDEVLARCNLVVTATSATEPLVRAERVRTGTHVTAVGADMEGKQELDARLFARADVCAVDSRSQCLDHGEAGYAVRAGIVAPERFVELGELATTGRGRTSEAQITVADLTGVAVQDIAIAQLVYAQLLR
jgi:ornithine cyclodeaminase